MKLRNFIKNNLKIVIAFTLGLLVAGTGVYAATVIAASSVSYSDNASLGATNVQDAIDKLNTKATTKIAEAKKECPSGEICQKTNSKGTIFASKMGICINRNNIFQCFKTNNWDVENNHIQQVFSDVSCGLNPAGVSCYASDFGCGVYSAGGVYCRDQSDYSYCDVNSDGYVDCN